MLSNHISCGKGQGTTAKARYAMSMNLRKGVAVVAPAWTPWIVPWGVPTSCARESECHVPGV